MPGKTLYGKTGYGLRSDGTLGPIDKKDPAYQHPNPIHRKTKADRGLTKAPKKYYG